MRHERASQIEQEDKLLQQKLKYQQMLDKAHLNQPKDGITAKLPKLLITKFNGSFSDWLSFWNKFQVVIDKHNIRKITKFAYLKELMEQRVQTSIDGLPFTEEVYTRAKEILLGKSGNNGGIVDAYVEEIIALRTISGMQPNRIHLFSEKLQYNIESLETLKKINNVDGYVRMTLNKLPGIRGNLVRTDPKWKDWNFNKLIEALRAWTERNPIETPKQPDNRYQKHDKPSRIYHIQQKKSQQRSNT